jgi:prepilin signal peptidase PulO-like enzyme (type II secretory pathway)
LPILGWWGLRREAPFHGRGFWVRPLLLELAIAFFFAWLYWWEVHGRLAPGAVPPADIHVQYLSHVVLVALMAVATFIDFDEKTIPDAITVPGTLLGLVFAAVWPNSQLPVVTWPPLAAGPVVENLRLTSPNAWPAELNTQPRWLVVGLAVYLGWCLAVTPAVWTTRRGIVRGLQYWGGSMVRHRTIWRLMLLAFVGVAVISPTWLIGGLRWEAMFSSLVGMAFGGGLVWVVRIVAGTALGKEAMGFGDVTLMAMIGAFLGWQPSLYIFFLAPFLGILIAIAQWVLTRRPDIAYGPYLCAAALCAIVLWGRIWTGWLENIFALGWFIPIALAVCLALMGLMLLGIQMLKQVLS